VASAGKKAQTRRKAVQVVRQSTKAPNTLDDVETFTFQHTPSSAYAGGTAKRHAVVREGNPVGVGPGDAAWNVVSKKEMKAELLVSPVQTGVPVEEQPSSPVLVKHKSEPVSRLLCSQGVPSAVQPVRPPASTLTASLGVPIAPLYNPVRPPTMV
jgi:hypothetical protein